MLSLSPSCKASYLAAALFLAPSAAIAHPGELAFVLLLPTEIYIPTGVATVAVTMVILGLFPTLVGSELFSQRVIARPHGPGITRLTTATFALFIVALIAVGFTGSRDPLGNPLPLFVFTVWWIGLVTLAGLVGNFWVWLNPWMGLYSLFGDRSDGQGILPLPVRFGHAPAILSFAVFALYLLADWAPLDPARLAKAVGLYGLYAVGGLMLFGPSVWLARGEAITMVMRCFSWLAALGYRDGAIRLGVPGWQLVGRDGVRPGLGLFVLVLLGTGSFDGLNETFWWLARIGVNPLEFPGRSAVFWQTVTGYIASNLILIAVFAAAVWLGLRLVGEQDQFRTAFGPFALSMIPIAFVYHFAHYLTAALVNFQYALAALSDPLGRGWDLIGLGTYYVTTSFFNTQATVQTIWLTQAGAVVLGHIMSVLVGHAIAERLLGDARRAAISQLPLSVFMIAYTLFGLWLLASPRGA